MTEEPLAIRTFTPDDQRAFARLSLDRNPMHLEADLARRPQMGAPVVHGIHTLLWAVDTVLRSHSLDIKNIKVRFHQPLFPGEIAGIKIAERTAAAINIEVVAEGCVVAAIRLLSASGKSPGSSMQGIALAPQRFESAADVPFEQMANQRGAVAAGAGDDEIRKLFPALSNSIGAAAVHALLATSQVVGMACPGRHSLFAGLDVNVGAASEADRALCYAVSKTDARFRSLQIDVAGSGIAGRLDAFARQPPPAQPGMSQVIARVREGAFAGQRALIVGGSRGLGEVTAKILAAGGGHPVITYREGKHEAEAVAADIAQAGGRCDIIRYDALEPAGGQLNGVGAVGGCYYFATARIFQRKSALYQPDRLLKFLNYYADGFYDLCTALAQDSTGRIGIFYPSTSAISEEVAGVAEYAMAKAAGEILAKYLNTFLPGIHVVSRRLPRIVTDQTATVGVASAQDALEVMLPIVYEVQEIART
jgi:acyl dehydratase/NAD(P)-dependent dehydrogenase (short-subunit alcohol dehydrogenase family)